MKYCTKCGTQLTDSDKFCTKCGAAQDVFVNTNNNRRSDREVFDDNTSDKSRTLASLLAFFLGGFGALDFYIGKKKKAITKLILTIMNIIFTIIVMVLMLQIYKEQGSMSEQETIQAAYSLIVPYIFIWIISIIVGIWNFIDFIITICGCQKDGEGRVISNWH